MATIKLTKRNVEALKAPDPSGRQQLFWAEGEYTGLGILVSGVTSSKSWVVQGKLHRKTKRYTIGPTSVFSIDEAWQEARGKLAELYRGNDPKKTAKRKAQRDITLRDALEAYFERSPNLSDSSKRTYRHVAERHFDEWLNKPLRSITHEAVETKFRNIARHVVTQREAGRTRGGGGVVNGRAVANLSMRFLKAVWNRQIESDPQFGANPVDVLRRRWHKLDRRQRHVPTEELPRFFQAALALPSAVQRDLVLLALFTGLRLGEASGLRWDEVDLGQKLLRISGPRMKNKRTFELPMSDVVADMLIARRALGNAGGHVFPGNGRHGHVKSFAFALDQIREATGIRVSPHDLRRTYASVMATCSIPPIAAKLLLSHAVGGDITFGYQILSQEQLREASQIVADRLKQLCGIAQPDGVVRLGDRA